MAGEHRKNTIKDWLKVLALLLDEVIALVLVLLVLWLFGIKIPLWLAIVGALVLGVFAFILPRIIIPTFHIKQVNGAEGMIGLEGKVIEPLVPAGVVQVEGEYWKAESIDEDIAEGEDVEVLGLNKLVLEVKHKDRPAEG